MLLDIGIGILAALFVSAALHIHASAWFIIPGIIFALLPDFDALYYAIINHGMPKAHRHRDMMHIPLLFIPAGTLLLFFFSPAYALLFFVCTLAHFIHDSIGIGWGVQWLYPFNSDHFSFLYLYQPPGKTPLPKKIFYRWRHDEIDTLDGVHGDPDWVRNVYLHMHPYAIVEAAVFIVALLGLYIYVF